MKKVYYFQIKSKNHKAVSLTALQAYKNNDLVCRNYQEIQRQVNAFVAPLHEIENFSYCTGTNLHSTQNQGASNHDLF